MGNLTLVESTVRAGVWQGLIAAREAVQSLPAIEVSHQGQALPDTRLTAIPGTADRWLVLQPIPAEVLWDGVQTFLVREVALQETLGHFTILTGDAVAQDMVAELDLLRAELDMLKRAFRRHCLDSGA